MYLNCTTIPGSRKERLRHCRLTGSRPGRISGMVLRTLILAACIAFNPAQSILHAEEAMAAPHRLDRPEILQTLYYPRQTGHPAPPAGARDIDIVVAEGVTLGCRLFTARKDAPVILYFHGNGETVPDYDDIGPSYTDQNLNFLVTDYRGYGWSGGSPKASTLISDGRTLFDKIRPWLAEHGYTGQLFVMGRSLGSINAIDLAAIKPDAISGLIIESGFAETIPLAMTLGIDLQKMGLTEDDGFNNRAKIEAVTLPTFILHGQRDSLIPVWQAEKLHAASGARSKELQIIPGADHNTMIMQGGRLYFETIRGFIDKLTGNDDWRQRRRDRNKTKTN